MRSRLWSSGGQSICNLGGRFTRPGDTPGVLTLGGYGGLASTASSSDPTLSPASQGLNMAYLDTGVDWGNATQRANMSSAVSALQSNGWFQADPIHLYGGSAGGVCVLQWALANPSRVASIVLNITPVDLQSLYDRDALSLQSSIGTAYGGRPGDSDNPALRADEFTEIPMRIFYSNDDPVGLAAETELFITESGAEGINMGDQGHNWDTAFLNASSVSSFFWAHS